MNTNIGIDDLLNDALQAYAELAGLTPLETGKSMTWGQYEGSKQIDVLNESRDLDPTGLTTFMLLRGLVDHFIDNAAFTAKEILTEPRKFAEEVKSIGRMVGMVENPEVVTLIEGFQSTLTHLAHRFGVADMKAYNALLNDKYELAQVRRDALRSIDKLQVFQFMQGKPSPTDLQVNGDIYEFWNINSLVMGLRDQHLDGVSLVLIRDPELLMSSYFVFAVKNGETITILTDRHEGPHPAYNRMSRRPDRELEKRAAQHWFPYQLLELKCTEDGHLYAPSQEGLVPYDVQARKLARVGSLYPEQVIWVSLMLDQINDRWGKKNLLLPDLSYTGEMVVRPAALASGDSSIVRSGDYRPLEVTPLTREDVTAETTASQWGRTATGFNEWLVEKFKDQVPEELLNPVGEKQRLLLQAAHTDKTEIERIRYSSEKLRTVETLSPVTFGSKEKLEKDRLWVARVNQCEVINKLAKREYNETVESVKTWVREHLKNSEEMLIEATARGELTLPDHRFRTFGNSLGHRVDDEGDGYNEPVKRMNNAIKVNTLKEYESGWGNRPTFYVGIHDYRNRPAWRCAVNGSAASIIGTVKPTCPEAIAVLCGVTVDQLPEPLQHWYSTEPYEGNSILDRIDPSDWKITNPWLRGFDPSVAVSMSKSGYNMIRKELGLPKAEVGKKEEE